MKPASASTSHLRLNIASLVLPGWSGRDGQRLASALRRELQLLLREQPLPNQSATLERITIERFRQITHERPEHTGRRLARVIADQLRGGE